MSVPSCPECGQSIPMSGSFSTSVKRPLSRTCSACEAVLPDHLFAHSEDAEPERESRLSVIRRKLTGE